MDNVLGSLEQYPDARNLFDALAAEEAQHKRELEIEYEKEMAVGKG